jgi:MraZ protein
MMAERHDFILGEFQRTFDDRYRLAIPAELLPGLGGEGATCVLAKERPGCLSLWRSSDWQSRHDAGVQLVKAKMAAGKLEGQLRHVQQLGRLLSTRHREVQLAGRGRLLVPEGFREFLRAQPGSEVLVVGAAVCLEIWNPAAWIEYLDRRLPSFHRLFDRLSS